MMADTNVVILDTGCANLSSVKYAIQRLGYEPKISREPDVVLTADKLFLPGVGTSQAAMQQLRKRNLIELIKACTQPVWGSASVCNCWLAAAMKAIPTH